MAKRPPSVKMPAIKLTKASAMPLHRQLYLALREQIAAGELREKDRLPSSRALARALKVSRNTVLHAFSRLAERNCIVAKVGSGTRVSAAIPSGVHRGLFRSSVGPDRFGGLSAILLRAHYPLSTAKFNDPDGNSLCLYSSRA